MRNRQYMSRAAGVVLTTIALLGAGSRLQADEASVDRGSMAQGRAIEGVWEPVVTIRDCQTQGEVATFLSMDTYIKGGSFLATSNGLPAERATGMGAWRHAGGRHYTAVYQFFTFNPDGSPSGHLKVSTRIRLSADGNAFRTTDTGEISDLQGNVIAQICATREATRLY